MLCMDNVFKLFSIRRTAIFTNNDGRHYSLAFYALMLRCNSHDVLQRGSNNNNCKYIE